jgi:pilus assembly protein Flp/PilA
MSAIGAGRAGCNSKKLLGGSMNNVKQILTNLMKEDSGQDLIEYALVAALVGLGAVASISGLSNSIGNTFNGVGTALTNATA